MDPPTIKAHARSIPEARAKPTTEQFKDAPFHGRISLFLMSPSWRGGNRYQRSWYYGNLANLSFSVCIGGDTMQGIVLIWKLLCFTYILALVHPVPEKIPIGKAQHGFSLVNFHLIKMSVFFYNVPNRVFFLVMHGLLEVINDNV